jgi:hypothetical protein
VRVGTTADVGEFALVESAHVVLLCSAPGGARWRGAISFSLQGQWPELRCAIDGR